RTGKGRAAGRRQRTRRLLCARGVAELCGSSHDRAVGAPSINRKSCEHRQGDVSPVDRGARPPVQGLQRGDRQESLFVYACHR
ncbi:unnamed protein product, partial [Ectocarpus sp. 12 AP-2014]